MKRSTFCLITLCSIWIASSAMLAHADSPAQLINAQVVFQDGSTITVSKARFVYHWILQSDSTYVNVPVHNTETGDLHYSETVHKVALDRIISGAKIVKLKLVWSKPTGDGFFTPEQLTVTLNDGKTVSLKNLDATSSFLLDKPAEEISDDASLTELTLDGIANIQGQYGRFSGRVFARSGVWLQPGEVIEEIVFRP